MTDINTESLQDFQKRLVQGWKDFDTESMSVFIEAEEQVSSLKLDIEGLQNNLAANMAKLAKQRRLSDSRTEQFNKSLDDLWYEFDKQVRTSVLDLRESISPDLSPSEMATAYDKATDKNSYDIPVDKFKYQEHLPDRQSDVDNSESTEPDNSRGNQIKQRSSRFRTDPNIEKRIKAKNNRYKRNLVKPSVKFLKDECKRLNKEYQEVIQGTDSGNNEERKKLLARLFIKLARHPEVRKEVWNRDNLKVIFGINCTEKILRAFSYPSSDTRSIKNFKESAECLNNIFKESIISDFEFNKIRTELLQEFLINLFHCYINPVYFNKDLILVISQELESKFAITWDALMNENCDYMRKRCPERNFGDLYFLGQMSRKGYYKVSDDADRELIGRLDDCSIKIFKLISYPLVFELFSRDFIDFFKCYDLHNKIINQYHENNSNNGVKNKNDVLFLSNIARQFKRHLVLSFINAVTEMYKYDEISAVFSVNDDESVEAENNFEMIRESINNIYPDEVEFFLQPRCRELLEAKMKTEYLGKVFMSEINSCVIKDDEHITALKVIRNGQKHIFYMKKVESYENALDYVRGVWR